MLVWWNKATKGQPRFRVHVTPTCDRAAGVGRATNAEVVWDDLVHARAFNGSGKLIGLVCPDCKVRLLDAHGVTERELLEVEA